MGSIKTWTLGAWTTRGPGPLTTLWTRSKDHFCVTPLFLKLINWHSISDSDKHVTLYQLVLSFQKPNSTRKTITMNLLLYMAESTVREYMVCPLECLDGINVIDNYHPHQSDIFINYYYYYYYYYCYYYYYYYYSYYYYYYYYRHVVAVHSSWTAIGLNENDN